MKAPRRKGNKIRPAVEMNSGLFVWLFLRMLYDCDVGNGAPTLKRLVRPSLILIQYSPFIRGAGGSPRLARTPLAHTPLTLSDNFVKLQFLAVLSQRASSAFGGGAIQRSNRNVLAQIAEEWSGGRLRRQDIGSCGERRVS